MKKLFLLPFIFIFTFGSFKKDSPKDTLFVILDSRPETLDPRKAVSANGMRLLDLVFNSFVKLDDKGHLKPDLAESWKLENLTWIFTLKPDLKFSNGRTVSKEDILFSFQEFRENSSFKHSFKNIKSVTVEKKKEKKQWLVKVTLKKFQAPFISSDLPVIKIMPKKESQSKTFKKLPFGTGEWSVVKNNFRQILLKRNHLAQHSSQDSSQASTQEASAQDSSQTSTQASAQVSTQEASTQASSQPSIKNNSPQFLSFQIIRDSLTRTQKMLSGEVDLAPSVLQLNQLKKFKNKDFKITSTSGFSTTYLLLNLKNPLLSQKEIRKVLSLAVNPQEIIKYKLYGYAKPARAFINPNDFFFNQNLKASPFDLDQAKQMIQKLGLENKRLSLSSSNNSNTRVKARVLASQISQTGLKISLESNDWGTFYKDVGQGAFDIALMKWVGVRDPDIYRIAFHSDNQAPKGRNRSFYTNKSLDELLEKGLIEREPFKRKFLYNKIQKIISEDIIVIPLWHDMEISVLKNNIENYNIRANGDFLSLSHVIKK